MRCYNHRTLFVTITLVLLSAQLQEAENSIDDTNPKRSAPKGTLPFKAFWNVPSYDCSHIFNISLHLDEYGIIANTGENFTGDNIVIFYQDELGLYPLFRKGDSGQPVNGGLLQVANLTAHLEKATKDLLTMIPDPAFSGIGIIDWEAWRPQWAQNFDTREVYRKQSTKLVQERHPEWTDETIELVALVEFEQAAKSYMDSTLRLVEELRPCAKWGFYHFPYCYNGKLPGRVCSSEAVASNENITWLFDSSTALYPSIYLNGAEDEKSKFVKGVVTEALRVRRESQNRFVDVYPYTRYLYGHSELFITKEDLNATILQSAQMGCSGVVFWGSNNDTHSVESCSQLRDYLQAFLGPFVKKVTDAANLCSTKICSGNGQCVGDILTCSSSLQKLEGKEARHHGGWQTLFPCSCNCYKGWNGTSCTKPG